MQTKPALKSDLDCLLDLNRDYLRSVQNSDVSRFQEILAEDFLCSLPNGSLQDREGFLKHTAVAAKIVVFWVYRQNPALVSVLLQEFQHDSCPHPLNVTSRANDSDGAWIQ